MRVSVCLVLVMAAAVAYAAEGRVPIYQAGTVINAQGSYYVTENLTGDGTVPVIHVLVGSVDIDLNGFTLTQPAGPAAVIRSERVDNLRIHGGRLAGGQRGVDFTPDAGVNVVIEDLTISTPTQEGIRCAYGVGSIFRRVNIVSPGGVGVRLDTPGAATVEECIISSPGSDAIHVIGARGVRVLKNTVRSAAGHGISVVATPGDISLGVQLRDNLLLGCQEGIHLAAVSGGFVWDNHVDRALSNGIHLLADTLHVSVRNNQVEGSTEDGILVDGSRSSVIGNHVTGSAFYGLRFTSTSNKNTYGGNSLAENAGNPTCNGTLVGTDFCNDGTSNGSFLTNVVPPLAPF